jgi:hypothetical protein
MNVIMRRVPGREDAWVVILPDERYPQKISGLTRAQCIEMLEKYA